MLALMHANLILFHSQTLKQEWKKKHPVRKQVVTKNILYTQRATLRWYDVVWLGL